MRNPSKLPWPENLVSAALQMSDECLSSQSRTLPEYHITTDTEATVFYLLYTIKDPRKRNVLIKRYKYGLQLEELGQEYGVTRERIRQLETLALRALIAPPRHVQMLQSGINEYCTHLQTTSPSQSSGLKNTCTTTSLADLQLSIRTYNCLLRGGIDTVEKLNAATDDDIMRIRNLGKRCYAEIYNILVKNGYSVINKGKLIQP